MIPVDNHTVKVNVTHDLCMKAQRGHGGVDSTIHIISTRRGGQHHTLATLSPLKTQHSLCSKVRHTIECGNNKLPLNPITVVTTAVLLDVNMCKYFIETWYQDIL
jgi:hypothetical protein